MRSVLAALAFAAGALFWQAADSAVAASAEDAVFDRCNGDKESASAACFKVCKRYEKQLDSFSNAMRGVCQASLDTKEARALPTEACSSASCFIRLKLSSRKQMPRSAGQEVERFQYAGGGYKLSILARSEEVGGYSFTASVAGPGGQSATLENNCAGNGCDGWERKSGKLSVADLTLLSLFEGKDIIMKLKR